MTGMVITAAAASVVMLLPSSGVPPADLLIPIDTAIEGGIAVGGEAPLATAASDDLEGQRCDVRAVRRDDAETNVGNDLIVESGDARVVLQDVERSPGAVTEGGSLTLGSTISVSLVMGPDQRFAAAVDVELRCGSEATPRADSPSSTADGTGSTDDGSATLAIAAVVIGALVVGAGAIVVIRRQRGRAAPPS